MALSFLSGLVSASATIDIEISDASSRRKIDIPRESGKVDKLLLYVGDEDPIVGKVKVAIKEGKKLDHLGIKVEMIGQIELFYDRGNHYEFFSKSKELEKPGSLDKDMEYDFEFKDVEKQCESYNGINANLRYFIRVTILRSALSANIVKEQDIWVFVYPEPPETNNTIKMEVGIEDCLHIEFEYGKSKYHLKDVVIGKIYFLLVRIKIKHMEIALIKRESCGSGSNMYNESETLTKFEIMDGAPVRGESIPVRLFLGGFELTPTYRNVHNKFSLKYYLNLVLVDDEDRRYFKQQEITLWRKKPGGMKSQPTASYSGVREAEAAKKQSEKEAAQREKLKKEKEKRRKKAEKEKEKERQSAASADGGSDKKEKENKEKQKQREKEKAAAAAAAEKEKKEKKDKKDQETNDDDDAGEESSCSRSRD